MEFDVESDKHSSTSSEATDDLSSELNPITSITASESVSSRGTTSDGDGQVQRSGSSSSPSSSTSSSPGSIFDDDYFLIDAKDPSNHHKHNEDAKLTSRDDGINTLGTASPNIKKSTPPIDPKYSPRNSSPMQSPPTQMMDRSEGASSFRIPSSVFARSKSAAPVEWSVASNESLFSIHVGNNSLSRDHIFRLGRSGELGLSGEFVPTHKPKGSVSRKNKSGDLIFPNNSGEFFPNNSEEFFPKDSGEFFPNSREFVLDINSSPPVPTAVVDPVRKSSVAAEDLGITEAAAETMKEVMVATENQIKNKKPQTEENQTSASVSYRSDGSRASFAFPILSGEIRKTPSAKVAFDKNQPKPQPQSQPPTREPLRDTARLRWCSWFRCCHCSCC